MWPCPSCALNFKNYCDFKRHTKSCDQTLHVELSQILSQCIPAVKVPENGCVHLPECDPMSLDCDLGCLALDSTTDQAPIIDNDCFPTSVPLTASWRGPPSKMPECSQSVPHTPLESAHDARVLGDARRHEAKMAKLWTNCNFRVLSQLVNSLSLSQSDMDRLLNAVKKMWFISHTILIIVADSRDRLFLANSSYTQAVEDGRGKCLGLHQDEGFGHVK